LSRGAGFAISVLQEWQRKTIEHPSVGTRPIASPQTGHHLVIVNISRIANPSEAAPPSGARPFGWVLPADFARQHCHQRLEGVRLASNQEHTILMRNTQLKWLVGEGAAIDSHRLVVNRGSS
jgi:hypothetical protein